MGKKRKLSPAVGTESSENDAVQVGTKSGTQSKLEDEQLPPETAAHVPHATLPFKEAPPLPDEIAPPLPNEDAPPLPTEDAPPLPSENAPPLPDEALPNQVAQQSDDGWEPIWDDTQQAYYFYNRFTKATQWENPRAPVANAPGTAPNHNSENLHPAVVGGYNPAIHGSYDPNADYAQVHVPSSDSIAFSDSSTYLTGSRPPGTEGDYAAIGTFNRFTGRFQAAEINPDNHNDEAKSKRQMAAFFDVDRAANSHDGRSLKAERSGKKVSKKELKEYQAKRREKKDEKRRAWLRD